jgi:hypothetical protein
MHVIHPSKSILKRIFLTALPGLLLLLSLLSVPIGAFAQDLYSDPFASPDEFAEEDPFATDFMDPYQNDFRDSTFPTQPGAGFEDPFQQPQDPFSPAPQQDDQYIDESQFSDTTEDRIRFDFENQQKLLVQERQNAISNVGYGGGTGLMIGTWFAFVQQETNTRNQFRIIGTSTVLGAIIGATLGTRAVWDPAGPRPTPATGLRIAPGSDGVKFAYQWSF